MEQQISQSYENLQRNDQSWDGFVWFEVWGKPCRQMLCCHNQPLVVMCAIHILVTIEILLERWIFILFACLICFDLILLCVVGFFVCFAWVFLFLFFLIQ